MRQYTGFNWLTRLMFRLTAWHWNRLISKVLCEHCSRGAKLSSHQLHELAAEFDPTQDAAFKRTKGTADCLWK